MIKKGTWGTSGKVWYHPQLCPPCPILIYNDERTSWFQRNQIYHWKQFTRLPDLWYQPCYACPKYPNWAPRSSWPILSPWTTYINYPPFLPCPSWLQCSLCSTCIVYHVRNVHDVCHAHHVIYVHHVPYIHNLHHVHISFVPTMSILSAMPTISIMSVMYNMSYMSIMFFECQLWNIKSTGYLDWAECKGHRDDCVHINLKEIMKLSFDLL